MFSSYSSYFNIFLHQDSPEKSLRHAASIVAEMLAWGRPHLLLCSGGIGKIIVCSFLVWGGRKKVISNVFQGSSGVREQRDASSSVVGQV